MNADNLTEVLTAHRATET